MQYFLAAQPDYFEPPVLSSAVNSEGLRHRGHVVTLYHQTSTWAGPKILKHGFRRGHTGWCGDGIYFATSPWSTYAKAIGASASCGVKGLQCQRDFNMLYCIWGNYMYYVGRRTSAVRLCTYCRTRTDGMRPILCERRSYLLR